MRAILALPPDQRLHGRRFDLEAEAWLNTVASNRNRGFEPDSRHLISLPRMLDNAAGALVRVEALRAAVDILREAESPPDVTAAQVSQRYESLLSEITFLADLEVMAAARARADAVADAWIDAVCTTVLDWVDAVIEAGATESIDALNSTLESIPLNLIPPGEGESADEFPEELAADTGLGEIVDAVRAHALRASWRALLLEHRPRETVEKLDGDLRRRLRAHARITPRRERHQRNPRVALPVTSLDRLSGNPELAHLFVRLTLDGRLLFLEDYEDGSYIDVYERVESKRRQMHARARERASLTDTGELQTGSSYLHTLGRTSDPFARTDTRGAGGLRCR